MVIVIGGGPAGMIAAIAAAEVARENGAKVHLLEKNEKLGKKLYITGKGRCNLTNNTDIQNLIANTVTNPRFMQSAYNLFTPQDLMAMIEKENTPLKTERGNRVFPVSNKAQDITDALARKMRKLGVKVALGCKVTGIEATGDGYTVHSTAGSKHADKLIIATGGLSYPSTGATGDGYSFAQALGHTKIPTCPSLVPLTTKEDWVGDLTGLSLKNVRLFAPKTFDQQGEMLFTPTGISGPLVLSLSSAIATKLANPLSIYIDLKPALDTAVLDARILKDFGENQNKIFANALDKLLPQRLIDVVVTLSQIPHDKKVHTITKKERHKLVNLLKALPLTVTQTAGYGQAVITKGGISTKEINPKTMESKKSPGLFFAGEIMDVDALTGGYNLQIAFSTGYAAGTYAAQNM